MRRANIWAAVAILGVCLFAPTLAGATPITLSSPTITSGPVTGPAVVAGPKPAQWFVGTWWSPSANQRFDNPYVSGGSLPGDYVYQITFDLTGLDPSSAVLAGIWTTDNAGSIWLNGTNLGSIGPGVYGSTTAFSFISGFIAGVNTLEFHVNNEDATGQVWAGPRGENPTGVFYSVDRATANAVPEPATLGLLGLGLLGLGAALRARRK